tara:strand:- start:649 stop:1233 length:585 start_codon:yes stop_codon:yes gene_type:complete
MAYKQHFVEWFSGKQIPSYWTLTDDLSGSAGSVSMVDAVDGGVKVTAAAVAGSQATNISFNDKRQYSKDGSVMIFVAKRDSETGLFDCGFTSSKMIANNWSYVRNRQTNTYYDLSSSDGSTSQVSSDVPTDASWHTHKIELNGANQLLSIDGSLKVTKSSDYPTLDQQPLIRVHNLGNASGVPVYCRYVECYNT